MRPFTLRVLVVVSAALAAVPIVAQQPAPSPPPTTRVRRSSSRRITGLVVGGSVTAAFLPDDRFWYRNTLADGAEFILVDPAKKTRARAFDHQKLAVTLSAAAGGTFDALHLPFESIDLDGDGGISFNLAAKRWRCDAAASTCAAVGDAVRPAVEPGGGRGGRGGGRGGAGGGATSTDGKPLALSPDGKRGVFIRDWNLWLHDVATRDERALTTDGVKYFGYATDNAGWSASDRAIVQWSPDSRKIATQQQDERQRRRDVPGEHDRRSPDAARVEVPAARRSGHGHDPPRGHRVGLRANRAAADAARLSPRDARRQHQHARLQLEP